ncbi:MAG: hypothetical protein AAGF75_10065, partial [Cyanobacteria bacterium P01_H01_bin.130]
MANVTQLLNLARQGSPEAIAAVMSRPLHKDGISVQVTRDRAQGLVIAFLGILAPDQTKIQAYVKRGLDKLGLSQVEAQVTVEGWAMGESEAEWRSTMPLAGGAPLPVAEDLEPDLPSKPALPRAIAPEPIAPPPTAAPASPPPKPAAPPVQQPRMNFAELQKIVGQVVETAIQPTIADGDADRDLQDEEFAAAALALDPTDETRIEPATQPPSSSKAAAPRQTLDDAFELLEASIAHVQSRNLPVEQVAVSTKVDLGPISLEIQLDVPSQGAPRVMKLDVKGDAAALARDADAPDPEPEPPAPEKPAIAQEGEFTQNEAIWSAEEEAKPDQTPEPENTAPAPPTDTEETPPTPEAESEPTSEGGDDDKAALKAEQLATARSLLEEKKYDEVIAFLNPLVEADNYWAEAYQLLGAGFFGQGKEPEGLLSLKVARNLYLQQANVAAALQVDQIFVQRNFNADGPEFDWVVGMVLYNQGKVDEAI